MASAPGNPRTTIAGAMQATASGAITISKGWLVSCSHWVPAPDGRRWCGHNWNVAVHLATDRLDAVGMVWDFGALGPVRQLVEQLVDHRHLDDLDGLLAAPGACDETAVRVGGSLSEHLAARPELPFASLIRDVWVGDAWPDSNSPAWRRVEHPLRFHAAHRLDGLPEGHKCSRPHGHGYQIGAILDPAVADTTASQRLQRRTEEFIGQALHQRSLNEVLGVNPTAEHLAWFLCDHFTEELGIRGIVRMLVAETPTTLAEYRP